MKIILSPAKSINTTFYNASFQGTSPFFLKEAKFLVSKLKKLKPKQLSQLMHISSDLAELNTIRYKNWTDPVAQSEHVIPSIFAFQGEVYRGFDAISLTEEDILFANEKIRIISGLYGILLPLTWFQPYRLEMGTKWSPNEKSKNLYQFWGDKLTKYLNAEMSKDEVLINLASSEYSKAIDFKKLKAKVVSPTFKEFKNGEYKIVAIFAKHQRGAMARYIVQNKIADPEQLKLYAIDGYSYSENLSTDAEWVFVR
ncbi:MAG: peroxide stress protein YaaA [Bacteroidota bacterium]